MKTIKLFVLGLSVLPLLTLESFAQITKTEPFDSDLSAKTNGWVELGTHASNMDYGYSAGTGYSGGLTGGEAGGKVGRHTIRSMYADIFGSPLDLSTPLTATGRIAIVFQNGNASAIFGHSDSTRVGLNQDSLAVVGIRTVPSTKIIEAVVGLTNVVRSATVLNGNMDVTGTTNYLWWYYWNPSGGTSSTGALTVAISDNFGGLSSFTNTVTLSISAADRLQNPKLDGFGMTTRSLGATAVYAQTYGDDFTYTALPSCVRVAPLTIPIVVPGQSNKTIAVTIPAAANLVNPVYVTVTSSASGVAEPLGATGGALTIEFPAAGATVQNVNVSGISPGNAVFTLSATNGMCFANNQVSVTVLPTATSVLATETFDSAYSAKTNGWVELASRLNGHNFGFSATTNAGGAEGEAGGDFRRELARATYADVFGGKLTLNDRIFASGSIFIPALSTTNAGPILGHSDSSKTTQATEANLMGLEVAHNATGMEFRSRLILASGGAGYEPAGLVPVVIPGVIYYWDYLYDPTGGVTGNGSLTVNVSEGTSFFTNTSVIELTSTDRATGAEFDSFGINARALPTSVPLGITAFMDNVTYTAIVGEPCVRYMGDTTVLSVVGQTNKAIQVSIPASANASADFHVRVTSLSPTVAAPIGANISGQVDVNFPVGTDVLKTIYVNTFAAGTAQFQLSTTNATCVTTNLVTVTVPCSTVTTAENETFDSAASATAHGWVELGSRSLGQNFGFSATGNAGGPAGEAGGTFKRDSTRSCYVDVYPGRLTLNDYISASGKLQLPALHSGNLGPNIGHSDSTKAGLSSGQPAEANNLALGTVFGTNLIVELILADGSRRGEVTFVIIPTSTVYDWSYAYDPTGGPLGNGSVTITVSAGGITNVGSYILTAADRAIGASFDSFGMTSRALASSTATGQFFIDSVAYSVPAPERITDTASLGNGNLRLTIASSRPCGSHIIQERTNVATGTWSTVSGVVFGTAPSNQITAEFPKPSGPRFYRAVLQ